MLSLNCSYAASPLEEDGFEPSVPREEGLTAKNFLHSGVLALSMLSAIPAIGEVTALDRYVAAPDPSYRYELIETIPGDGYAVHVLEMTSQRWRDETEVDRPLWKHWLTVIEPEQVATGTALLIIGGGSNER